MKTIGRRLRRERERLRMTQLNFAIAGGVLGNAQGKYEAGTRSPNARYLTRLLEIGVDILYVLTGVESTDEKLDCERSEVHFCTQLERLTKRERKIITDLLMHFIARK